MVKFKNFIFAAVIVAYAGVFNIFGVKNSIFGVKSTISGFFKESPVSVDVLRNEVIKLIELKEFSKADKMISSTKSSSTELEIIVEEIVKKINQFDISFEYATKTSMPQVVYLILKNLWFELNSGNNINLIQSMDIYRAIYSKVIQNQNVNNELFKSLARETCEEIRIKIINMSVPHLKSLLLATFFDELGAKEFLEYLFKTSERIFEDVNKLVIDQIYESLPLDELLYRTLYAGSYPFPLNVFLLSDLLSKNAFIFNKRELNFFIPLQLIAEKQEYEQNNSLSDFTKNKLEQLFDFISSDLKILHLSEHICFRNYISNEYICRLENHDVDLCVEKSSKSFWQIYLVKDHVFHIRDSNNTKQHMYMSRTETNIVRVGNSSEYDRWMFFKKENSFFIVNFDTLHFLCPSETKKRVTSLVKNGIPHDECRWLVENCEF